MKKKNETDEIDIIDVIINIWNNKIRIALITVIFITLSIAQFYVNPSSLRAKTEILPIDIIENNLYEQYNLLSRSPRYNLYSRKIVNLPTGTLGEKDKKEIKSISNNVFNEININYLLSLFLEELRTKDIIVEAIKKYQLIDKKNFDSEDEYLKAVENRALKFVLLKKDDKNDKNRLNWTIEFEVYDKDKWEKALSFIESEANKNVKKYVNLDFDTKLDSLKMHDQFKLEDLNLKIKNVKKDYEIEISNRLAFLKEQASIAREINIEKNNTFEFYDFNNRSYYMRGYGMIEKEIELIETRTNKDAFTENLLDLEKDRRNLLEDKSLKRIEQLFNSTPIVSGNNFKVAEIIYKDTKYVSSSSLTSSILYAGIFGIIFGMFYVFISNAIQQRK